MWGGSDDLIVPNISQENHEAFCLKQRYLRIGDRIETILGEISFSYPEFPIREPSGCGALCAFVTLFQFVEKYNDLQAAEAVRTRPDWKYALHLPLSFDAFEPGYLCAFRASMFAEPSRQQMLQTLVDRLATFDLYVPTTDIHLVALDVISNVCRINQILHITEAMLLAVEALAARATIHLSNVCLPDLYEYYAKMYHRLQQVETHVGMGELAYSIGLDIADLWNTMQLSRESYSQCCPEMDILWKLWRQQYGLNNCCPLGVTSIIWEPVDCLRCKQAEPEESP